jgi:hypothetical protein
MDPCTDDSCDPLTRECIHTQNTACAPEKHIVSPQPLSKTVSPQPLPKKNPLLTNQNAAPTESKNTSEVLFQQDDSYAVATATSKLSTGAIIGIAIGCLVVIVASVSAGVYFFRRETPADVYLAWDQQNT